MDIPPMVARQVKPGHEVEEDPFGGFSQAERWTCTRCGSAVLRCGSNIYGSATEKDCEAST